MLLLRLFNRTLCVKFVVYKFSLKIVSNGIYITLSIRHRKIEWDSVNLNLKKKKWIT